MQRLASTDTLASTDGAHCAEGDFGIPPTLMVFDSVTEIATATFQVIGGDSPKSADGATARGPGASAAGWRPNQLESFDPTASHTGSIGPLVYLQPASTNATVLIRGLQHSDCSSRISRVGLPGRIAEREVGEHLATLQPPPHGTHWPELRAVTWRTNQPGSTAPTAATAGGIGAVVNLQLASNIAASLPRNTRRAMPSAAFTRIQPTLPKVLIVNGMPMVARRANQPVAAIPTTSRRGGLGTTVPLQLASIATTSRRAPRRVDVRRVAHAIADQSIADTPSTEGAQTGAASQYHIAASIIESVLTDR